jgi:hypothetical protein
LVLVRHVAKGIPINAFKVARKKRCADFKGNVKKEEDCNTLARVAAHHLEVYKNQECTLRMQVHESVASLGKKFKEVIWMKVPNDLGMTL